MAQFSVAGTSGGVFSWSAVYDDVAHTVTLQADGSGRCTVSVAETNGAARSAAFVQHQGDTPVPVAAGINAPIVVTVLVNGGAVVLPNIRLKTSTQKGADGGFDVLNESWSRV